MKLAICVLFLALRVYGAVYYVDVTTDPSGDGSQGNPWDAIGDATSTAVAGDTIYVLPGTYAETVTESTDGTLANPITYVSTGTATITGLTTLSGDYIRWIGFTHNRGLSGTVDALNIQNAVGVEIWNCTFTGFTRNGVYMDSGGATAASHRCILIGNTFIGTYGTAGTDAESRHMAIRGNANLIAYNTLNTLNIDGIYWFGSSNRFVGNYGFNANSNSAAHCDFLQTGTDSGGNTYTLMEANFYVDSDVPSEDHHLYNMSNTGTDFTHCIYRFNVTHQIGQNQIFGDWSNFYVYNESFIESCRLAADATLAYFSVYGLAATVDNVRLYHNIMVDTWGSSVTTPQVWYHGGGASFLHDFNLAWDSNGSVTFNNPFNSEANSQKDVDPQLVSQSTDDFRLGSGSPARNAGTSFTLANGGGTGTDVTVDDAGFFRGDEGSQDAYSGALVTGDKITIGTDQVTIVSIAGDVITVTPSITWADNDPVYFGWDTTPDLGAYPYSHTPMTAATYSGTTVTPNGDTRFVVAFTNGIPAAVDNDSPYEFPGLTGTVTYRAYPMFASKTTSALATEESNGPFYPSRASNTRTRSIRGVR